LGAKKINWATPLSFLECKAGDCEDFTIAKYSHLGAWVPDEQLRLVYVKGVNASSTSYGVAVLSTNNFLLFLLDNIDKELKPRQSGN